MPEIRGLTVCWNYAPLLAITLPLNMRHLTECWVITHPDDTATQEVACSVPGVKLHITDSFTKWGARVNKGLCIEECLDAMGRHGMMWIWDADILFPPEAPFHLLRPNHLHGAHRRILEDPTLWTPDLDWRTLPISRDGGAIGFTQIFAAEDPALANKRPWYDVSFGHAGGGDAYFMEHWPYEKRKVLPFDVLHLGRTDVNWFGVDQAGKDMMARFVHENGWRAAKQKHTPEAVARSPEVIHRVEVPGYPKSDFELPFVDRARLTRGG